MAESIHIPENLRMTFKRLLFRLPEAIRDDVQLQKTLLVYLKFGGEKMAHHCIKKCQMNLQDEVSPATHMFDAPFFLTHADDEDSRDQGEEVRALG